MGSVSMVPTLNNTLCRSRQQPPLFLPLSQACLQDRLGTLRLLTQTQQPMEGVPSYPRTHPRKTTMVAYCHLRQLRVRSDHAGGSRVSRSRWSERSDDLRSRRRIRCHRHGTEKMKENLARLRIRRPYALPGQQAAQRHSLRRRTATRQYSSPPLARLPP